MTETEYSASDIRKLLQQLFPQRRLVLSQFTFFSHRGVARATGETYRRGRRCYRLHDILSIASIIALKEEGIPLKNIDAVPQIIQEHAERIFAAGPNCRLSGYRDSVCLQLEGVPTTNEPVERFLEDNEATYHLFWSYDLGRLAQQLEAASRGELQEAPYAAHPDFVEVPIESNSVAA